MITLQHFSFICYNIANKYYTAISNESSEQRPSQSNSNRCQEALSDARSVDDKSPMNEANIMPHSSLLMQPMTTQLWVSAIKIAVFIIAGHQLGVR